MTRFLLLVEYCYAGFNLNNILPATVNIQTDGWYRFYFGIYFIFVVKKIEDLQYSFFPAFILKIISNPRGLSAKQEPIKLWS